MQGLRSLWSALLITLALLCDNKGPSAVCQQKSKIALTLNYLYGLSSFKKGPEGRPPLRDFFLDDRLKNSRRKMLFRSPLGLISSRECRKELLLSKTEFERGWINPAIRLAKEFWEQNRHTKGRNDFFFSSSEVFRCGNQKVATAHVSLRIFMTIVHRKPILLIIRKIFCSRNYFPFFHISLCCSPFVLSFTFTSKSMLLSVK